MTNGIHATAPKAAPILVVEDDRDMAETTARLLGLFGHRVRVARNGYEAIELARRDRPRYVLLDIGLPGIDGYEVALRLRRECGDPLLIIAITGYGQMSDIARARSRHRPPHAQADRPDGLAAAAFTNSKDPW